MPGRVYGARLNWAQFPPTPTLPHKGGGSEEAPHPNPPLQGGGSNKPPTSTLPYKGGGRTKAPSPLVREGWGEGEGGKNVKSPRAQYK
jgi:hypothetical protein